MALFKKEVLRKLLEEENKPKTHTILIVDDEHNNLDSLSKVLEEDYHVLTASDGQEALDLIRREKEHIQLIISDQRMPRLTGVEFLEQTLQIIPKVKRIILSGFADVEAVIAAINRARIYEFILKPVDVQKLILTVRRALEAFDLERKNIGMMEELRDLNRNLEGKVADRTRDLEQRNQEILRTQNHLIMQEKMASVGIMTSGIAHELKNPLNFVNNLSSIAVEICEELGQKLPGVPDGELRGEMRELIDDLKSNAKTISKHGDKADQIVKNMMQLAGDSDGDRHPTDLNHLVDEYVSLAYMGKLGSEHPPRVAVFKNYDPTIGDVDLVPRNMCRALVNIVNNALESMTAKLEVADEGYEPALSITTRNLGHTVELRIRDNGLGMTDEQRDRVFNPFYTTKPPGTGNIGLGLSICYEVITREHDGEIRVETEENEYAEMIITLPRPRV